MRRIFCSFALLFIAHFTLAADDEAEKALVKRKAQEVGTAVIKGDFAKVVDLTYPKVVTAMGGREKMIAAVETGMKQMKTQGFSFRSLTAGTPGAFLTEGGNTFTIVPTTLEMGVPGGKAIAKGYLLGISADGGKAWTFVDGAGLESKQQREIVLPKLPPMLKLPEKQKPEFTKDP